MTKYVAFKTFEINGKEEDLHAKMKALGLEDMAIVHEDYYEGVIKANLDQIGKCPYCGGKEYDELHYDCEAEHNMIARKEERADMEEAMSGEPHYD